MPEVIARNRTLTADYRAKRVRPRWANAALWIAVSTHLLRLATARLAMAPTLDTIIWHA